MPVTEVFHEQVMYLGFSFYKIYSQKYNTLQYCAFLRIWIKTSSPDTYYAMTVDPCSFNSMPADKCF